MQQLKLATVFCPTTDSMNQNTTKNRSLKQKTSPLTNRSIVEAINDLPDTVEVPQQRNVSHLLEPLFPYMVQILHTCKKLYQSALFFDISLQPQCFFLLK